MAKRILIAVCIFLGTAAVLALNWPGIRRPSEQLITRSVEIGGPFTLTDMNGNTVTDAVLKGHYSLLYFGFTRCPDVCPLALQKITEALNTAGPTADTVVPVFITVDPEHDTPEVMKAYLANFHPRFLGLTGTPDAVKQAENDYRVYASKTTTENGDSVAHGDFIYFLDTEGKYVAQFPNNVAANDIALRLRHALEPQ
ncbi:MAG: SCO family protein [Rhodospirillaceae bacterium]|nr:MAG: SCO family protein [Rhodospirillaceae bacterium]